MVLILSYTEETIYSELSADIFQVELTSSIYKEGGSGQLWKMNKEEYWADQVSKRIMNSLNKYEAIIIDKNQGTNNWERPIRILGHIFLDLEINKINYNLPVLITSKESLQIEEIRNLPIPDFFSLPGVWYKSHSELYEVVSNHSLGISEYAISGFLRTNQNEGLNGKLINVPYNRDNRHQISNEWGAIRLLENSGYSQNDINYNPPNTLYFKYLALKQDGSVTRKNRKEFFDELIENGKLNINKHPHFKNKKVLLVDDNSDKGWEEVLSLLFKCPVEIISSIDRIDKVENYDKYGIVFFDLYMPNPTKDCELDMQYSKRIIKILKNTFPHVPIIVFTASNKAWTFDDVINIGADGVYIKESPEFALDPIYSYENFKSFVYVVKNVITKYNTLSPYWINIQKIINSDGFKDIQEEGSSLFKDRIIERLEMFYGLIKRGFEQSDYNKNRFHFSDYELAFMTLWSILNEISSAYYLKTQPLTYALDIKKKQVLKHPNGKDIAYLNIKNGPKHYKWEIKGQSDVFLEYHYKIKYDYNGREKCTNNNYYKFEIEPKSTFSYSGNKFDTTDLTGTKVNFETTLYMQIAFLLHKKTNLSKSSEMKRFQQSLVRLNEIRNRLYLTHGMSISTGFFNKTEFQKRKTDNITPKGDIKELFELIYFILVGEKSQIIID